MNVAAQPMRASNQDTAELAAFLDFVRKNKVRSYLEIGCRNGDTFNAVMRTIGAGGRGLAVDLPENSSTRKNLQGNVDELNHSGIHADVLFGNSQHSAIINSVISAGPFDLILIDADHRYECAKQDFETYKDLGAIIALHDVDAPDGHLSDGHVNGVGRLWREIKDGFRHQEFITPGSNMGFGVLHRGQVSQDVPAVRPAGNAPPLFIACPAWGQYYVDLACRFTIPAVLASLKESRFTDVTFLIHTDDEASFRKAIGDYKIKFLKLLPMSRAPQDDKMERLPDNYWVAFKQAHKDAINATPQGAIVTLLNSDVVVSRECFSFVDVQMAAGKKVVSSVGIRTQIEDNSGPPVGASAEELFTWIWGHRHHITEECIWGKGRSHHPTILFFEDESGVAMHCFHLTPMFIKKDRVLQFKGTIDDDLLARFSDDEICTVTGGEIAFAELSPNWKTHPFGKPLNVPDVLGFWARRAMRPHYLRNFRHRMKVLGSPQKNHPAVDQIVTGLGG